MEFTIERSRWYRGQGGHESALLRKEDSLRCCLGFYGEACGVPDYEMLDISTPFEVKNNVDDEFPIQMEWLIHKDGIENSQDCLALVHINDASHLPESEREAQITEIFARNGHTVTFVN